MKIRIRFDDEQRQYIAAEVVGKRLLDLGIIEPRCGSSEIGHPSRVVFFEKRNILVEVWFYHDGSPCEAKEIKK